MSLYDRFRNAVLVAHGEFTRPRAPAPRRFGEGMLGTECLWQLGASAQTVSSNGNSGPVDVTDWENFILMVSVGAPSGSSPTLAVHLDGYDAYGNAYQDLCSNEPVLNFTGVAGQNLVSSIGIDAQFVPSTAAGTPGNFNQLFCAPQKIAIRWVVGGSGGPSFPAVCMSLFAR
jgi:hypothetical protein